MIGVVNNDRMKYMVRYISLYGLDELWDQID